MSVEDEAKNKYVLVVIDSFTRFVELYPCSSIDGKTVVFALLQHVERYGGPATIQSDRGDSKLKKKSPYSQKSKNLVKSPFTAKSALNLLFPGLYCQEAQN